ncbi:hypothetical protein FA15DRAFT_673188 [Coprinopsis marcescibilis]|uniref:Uncharacterized protein n=1 Tax=Coprinopsis marcescibilis TaxID=230819 RepID=A0A5C3KKP7_COPMA|nr:hypothetical protein FA15DRAFT_673188 [Coprinopsis marcescibilis]
MDLDLPSEVWTEIFTLAADEDLIFQYALPTCMADSSWFKHVTGNWALRSPQEAVNLLMRRSYRTKKAILVTCKRWHEIAFELMLRCLYFNTPAKLFDLCKILESSSARATTVTSSLGWWTRRLHVCSYSSAFFENQGISTEAVQNALVLIISHCPNLQVFHVDWPMKQAFGPVANALMRFSKRSLRSVTWNVPTSALSKVIWALDSLKFVVAAHIEFESSSSTGEAEDECVHLGSAHDLQLNLRHIRQLSVRGYTQLFIEQAIGWLMPSLTMFSVDSGISEGDLPDVAGFIAQHGEGLLFLDLDTSLALDVAKILDRCPQLNSFTFNADWGIISNDDKESEIVNRPRPTITTIGLHGLSHAFGVGVAALSATSTHSRISQRSNDMNFMALNKKNFPNLRRIRVLDRSVLKGLNEAGQPSVESGGMERWQRWWDRCALAGIQLQDCTGDDFGNLPDSYTSGSFSEDEEEYAESEEEETIEGIEEESDEESSDEEGDEDEYDDDEYDDEDDDDDEYEYDDGQDGPDWNAIIPPMPQDTPTERTQELRNLLEECRVMSSERDDSMMPMFAMMGMGMGAGLSSYSDPHSEAMNAFERVYGPTRD